MQRRLTDAQVSDLLSDYAAGRTIDSLAREFAINRTTVIAQLDRSEVLRRKVARKLTDELVAAAAEQYALGDSLLTVANAFGVVERTLSREFKRAGVPIRSRRGQTPAWNS